MTEPLPTLVLASLERCVLHEVVEAERVERLEALLRDEDVLRNPPIVARYAGSDRLLVLDGATRITVLRSLGLAVAPVQIVNYADSRIELHTWAHVLHDANIHSLLRSLRSINGLRVSDLHGGTPSPRFEDGEIGALLTRDGEAWLLRSEGDTNKSARLLQQTFACYASRATIKRVPQDDTLAAGRLPEGAIAVLFPRYTKLDLLELSRAGAVLPAGITRHIIPGRVLRLNVPLVELRTGDVEAQAAWFEAWVSARIAAGHARLYVEPTWLFDE